MRERGSERASAVAGRQFSPSLTWVPLQHAHHPRRPLRIGHLHIVHSDVGAQGAEA